MPPITADSLQPACIHHGERAGFGVCRSCQRSMCRDCVTFVEGILCCAECLEPYLHLDATHDRQRQQALVDLLTLIVGLCCATGLIGWTATVFAR